MGNPPEDLAKIGRNCRRKEENLKAGGDRGKHDKTITLFHRNGATVTSVRNFVVCQTNTQQSEENNTYVFLLNVCKACLLSLIIYNDDVRC